MRLWGVEMDSPIYTWLCQVNKAWKMINAHISARLCMVWYLGKILLVNLVRVKRIRHKVYGDGLHRKGNYFLTDLQKLLPVSNK